MITREQIPAAMYDCVLEILNMRRARMATLGVQPLENLDDIPADVVQQFIEEIIVANMHYAKLMGEQYRPMINPN